MDPPQVVNHRSVVRRGSHAAGTRRVEGGGDMLPHRGAEFVAPPPCGEQRGQGFDRVRERRRGHQPGDEFDTVAERFQLGGIGEMLMVDRQRRMRVGGGQPQPTLRPGVRQAERQHQYPGVSLGVEELAVVDVGVDLLTRPTAARLDRGRQRGCASRRVAGQHPVEQQPAEKRMIAQTSPDAGKVCHDRDSKRIGFGFTEKR